MTRSVVWLVATGWGLFFGSLLLPAARVRVPELLGYKVNIDETFTGWWVATVALRSVRELRDDPALAALCLAGLGNIAFLLSPLAVFARGGRLRNILQFVLIIALGAGLVAAWQAGGLETIRAGFYAWIAAFALVITALELRRQTAVRGREAAAK